MNLEKTLDLINSEGTILGLYLSKNKKYFLGSKTTDSLETIYFKVTDHELKMYINGYITLNELYGFSDNIFIVTKSGRDKKTYIFDQYSCNLTYGDLSYDQINIDMKPIIGLDEFSFNVDEE